MVSDEVLKNQPKYTLDKTDFWIGKRIKENLKTYLQFKI
jgi:hypothetical protein